MTSFIPKERIRVLDEVTDWRSSIIEASQPLLEQGCIEEGYVEAMIHNVEENGAYIVLAPHFALPHADKREYVKETAMSVLLLKEAVDFNQAGEEDEDRWVRLLIVLAAKDSNSHLQALQGLASLLDEDENIDLLLKQESPEELEATLNQLIGED